MDMKFWRKQEQSKPLFPDIEWNKPERRNQAGKMAIIGGNKLGFLAVADSYQEALKTGVGEVRVLLPDALKKSVLIFRTNGSIAVIRGFRRIGFQRFV